MPGPFVGFIVYSLQFTDYRLRLHPLSTDLPKPERFTYPFCYEPHPLCLLAAEEVKQEIARIKPTEGKMFGVLVVEERRREGVRREGETGDRSQEGAIYIFFNSSSPYVWLNPEFYVI